MLKRYAATGLLLGLAALVLIVATTASAYLYKKPAGHDCGKVTFTGGFGGPAPSNVPANAKPQVDTFIVKGKISCASAKRVMASFDEKASTPPPARAKASPRPAGSAATAPSSRTNRAPTRPSTWCSATGSFTWWGSRRAPAPTSPIWP